MFKILIIKYPLNNDYNISFKFKIDAQCKPLNGQCTVTSAKSAIITVLNKCKQRKGSILLKLKWLNKTVHIT